MTKVAFSAFYSNVGKRNEKTNFSLNKWICIMNLEIVIKSLA